MKKQIKKNSFTESTFISYFAIVASKVLGVVYNIPFYALIGTAGGFIYSIAYQIYALFLDISTSGIPTAISGLFTYSIFPKFCVSTSGICIKLVPCASPVCNTFAIP